MEQALPRLTSRTAHVCVDMQRLFSPDGPWSTPWLPKVVPQCVAVAQHRPEATIFTRFVTPVTADAAEGAWKGFYRRWPETTRTRIDAALLELVPELASLVPQHWSSINRSIQLSQGGNLSPTSTIATWTRSS